MARKAKLIPEVLVYDERVVFESRPSAWLYMKSASLAIIIAIIALILFAWDWVPDAPEIPYISTALAGDYGITSTGPSEPYSLSRSSSRGEVDQVGKHHLCRHRREDHQAEGHSQQEIRGHPGHDDHQHRHGQTLSKRALGTHAGFSTQGLGQEADMVWDAVPNR